MKAILLYGQFTSMIELPDIKATISIMKPQNELSFMPLDESTFNEITDKRLEFRLERRLTDEIALYKFVNEL